MNFITNGRDWQTENDTPAHKTEEMKIENITSGICQSRLQQGRPSFFVAWEEDGKRKYEFFEQVCPMYKLKERLMDATKLLAQPDGRNQAKPPGELTS